MAPKIQSPEEIFLLPSHMISCLAYGNLPDSLGKPCHFQSRVYPVAAKCLFNVHSMLHTVQT